MHKLIRKNPERDVVRITLELPRTLNRKLERRAFTDQLTKRSVVEEALRKHLGISETVREASA